MAKFITRRATAADCEEIYRLFQEQVSSGDKQAPPSPETLKKDGLGKLFHILVAEDQKGAKPLIGYLFFHFIYSTWQGKSILLTDVYITPEFTKKSVAKELFILLCKTAIEEGCTRLEWAVREYEDEKNEFVAISNATNLMDKEGWCKYRFSKEKLVTS